MTKRGRWWWIVLQPVAYASHSAVTLKQVAERVQPGQGWASSDDGISRYDLDMIRAQVHSLQVTTLPKDATDITHGIASKEQDFQTINKLTILQIKVLNVVVREIHCDDLW